MPLKTILFLFFLATGFFASILFGPFYGVLLYLLNYNISPAEQWWGEYLQNMGIRYAQISALSILLGYLFHRDKISLRNFSLFELLFLLFVLWLFLSHIFGLPPGSLTVRNANKMLKVLIFCFLLLHIRYNFQKFTILLWLFVIIAFYQAIEANRAPEWAFFQGRLNLGFGGPDFKEGNFLGAHFASILPIVGYFLLKYKSWYSKLFLLCVAVFIVNAIVLIKSRGVFLSCVIALFFSILGIIFFLKKNRFKIIMLILIGVVGALFLTDPGFWGRMYSLKTESPEEYGLSAKGRLWAWKVALRMINDYPLGIGEGNFRNYVGIYDDRIYGKDTHNTYFRCLAELGYPGFLLLVGMIFSSFWTLYKIFIFSSRIIFNYDILLCSFSLFLSLIILLVSSFFITETYVEEFYIFLSLPFLLKSSIKT